MFSLMPNRHCQSSLCIKHTTTPTTTICSLNENTASTTAMTTTFTTTSITLGFFTSLVFRVTRWQARSPVNNRKLRSDVMKFADNSLNLSNSLTFQAFQKTGYTHTHTHPFNGPFSGTTQVSRYQKGRTNLDFTEARDSEWQWHQLGHMQVCTSLQTDNHASIPPLSFLQAVCPYCRPTNSVKALKELQKTGYSKIKRSDCTFYRLNVLYITKPTAS